MTSSRTQSTPLLSSASIAAGASAAASTQKPSTARKSVSNPTISGSSSTSSTVGAPMRGSVPQPPPWRRRFPQIFIGASRRDHCALVHWTGIR
jgi:hypothetical protein